MRATRHRPKCCVGCCVVCSQHGSVTRLSGADRSHEVAAADATANAHAEHCYRPPGKMPKSHRKLTSSPHLVEADLSKLQARPVLPAEHRMSAQRDRPPNSFATISTPHQLFEKAPPGDTAPGRCMTRVNLSAGQNRDLERPLVEVDPGAPATCDGHSGHWAPTYGRSSCTGRGELRAPGDPARLVVCQALSRDPTLGCASALTNVADDTVGRLIALACAPAIRRRRTVFVCCGGSLPRGLS